MENIRIIGAGLVSPLGSTLEETWQRMLAGEVGTRPLDRFPTEDFVQKQGGQLESAQEESLRLAAPDDDLALPMILSAVREALADKVPPPRTGLILASNFGFLESREWCWRERLDLDEMEADSFDRQQDVIARVGNILQLVGPRTHLSLSCASGAAALALGRQWLLAGRCTHVVVVCYDTLTEFCWCGLNNLRTITDEQLRPFDKRRHGTLFGEGAGALWLTTEQTAELTWGYLLGAATNNNAYHLTAPSKGAEGSRRAMAAALKQAGWGSEDLDFVCAHATGTTANDVTEAAAINALLAGRSVPVAAFKSNLGHLLGAAGMAEVICSLCALRDGILPAIVGLEEPDPECNVDWIQHQPRYGSYGGAVTNSAGIGGNNAATALSIESRATPANDHRAVSLQAISWILPHAQGVGIGLPDLDPASLLQDDHGFDEFSVKPYLHSVKGYLDKLAAYALAATALCLEQAPAVNPETTAIVSVTQYGALGSAYSFFSQMTTKGHRFASPMIFPHAYSNTAGNLIAIEFGFQGPHLVFDLAPDAIEAAWAAMDLVRTGAATEVFLVLCEASIPEALPDGQQVLNGALCLKYGSGQGLLPEFQPAPNNRQGVLFPALADLLPKT